MYWTNSMEQGPSWEANSHSASQQIPRLLWNWKVHYRLHENMLLVLSWARFTFQPYFPKIHSDIIFQSTPSLQMVSFPQVFRSKSCTHLSSLPWVYLSRPSHPPWLITPICREAFKLWSSSPCSLLQPPATSSLLGPNILLSTMFSSTLSLYDIHSATMVR